MMRKLDVSKEFDLDIFYEKLDNGLEIYLVPMLNKDKYYLTYATKFGSTTTHFIDGLTRRVADVPNGIAHFLEHKMFEQEDGVDPFNFFSQSGTECNASTDYEMTRYIVSGTKKFKENLKYLINYVNKPYFTLENVNKEKGIITQEINMYKDEAESQIENTIRQITYNIDKHRNDIAGEVSDIEKITKEDLYLCYNNFYNPRNMFLLVVGNFSMEDVENVIDDCLLNLENKTSDYSQEIVEVEDEYVKEEYVKIPFNITVPKVMMSIKTARKKFKIKDEVKLDLYLSIIINIIFGISSLFREKMTNKNLISNFYTDIEKIKDYRTIYLYSESIKPEVLINEINKELENISITSEDLERFKKVIIANEIRQADYVDSVTYNITSEIERYGKVVENSIEVIKSLNIEELNEVLKSINITNKAVALYVPNNMPSYENEELF